MKKNMLISLKLFLFLTVLTGIIYPLLMTILSGALFPFRSQGSMIESGPELIGQDFSSAKYFTPRPSAITYNPLPSGASNYGPTSSILKDSIGQRKKRYILFNHLPQETIVPEDALFASASGVDPHISPQNAFLQIGRVADARGFSGARLEHLRELINMLIEKPQFGILGEERINVLVLNTELDKLH